MCLFLFLILNNFFFSFLRSLDCWAKSESHLGLLVQNFLFSSLKKTGRDKHGFRNFPENRKRF